MKTKLRMQRRLFGPSPMVVGIMGCWSTAAMAELPSGAGLPNATGHRDSIAIAQANIASSRPINDSYVLGAGDLVSVNIFNVPEYSGQQKVLTNGTLNLPVVGMVKVEGLTLQSAGESQFPTVTQALQTAGGVTQAANLRQVEL